MSLTPIIFALYRGRDVGARPDQQKQSEREKVMSKVSRRAMLRALAAAPAVSLLGPPLLARAADIELRYGNNLPLSHPLNIRAQEAADRLREKTSGRVDIKIFPNNQLGGDTDMLSQVRSGALTFFTPSALVIATLVPVAAINAVGFAFADYDQVWSAMDGGLGAYVRAAIAKANLHAFEKIWDNGFRQMTTSARPIETAEDMAGLKKQWKERFGADAWMRCCSTSRASLIYQLSVV
jgi:TRAP-type C4-dicarboxylate transport system substrate-binding protein